MTNLAVCILMAVATGSGSAAQVEPNTVMTKGQAEQLAHTARIPEEHSKLAGWYRSRSQELMKQARDWRAMAEEYDRNPSSHPVPKFPNFGQHSRQLAHEYEHDALKAEASAQLQDQLAQNTLNAANQETTYAKNRSSTALALSTRICLMSGGREEELGNPFGC